MLFHAADNMLWWLHRKGDPLVCRSEIAAPVDADGGDLREVEFALGLCEGLELTEHHVGAGRVRLVQIASRACKKSAAACRVQEHQQLGGSVLILRHRGVDGPQKRISPSRSASLSLMAK